LEKIKRRISIKDATNLPSKAHVPENVIHKPFTRDHCAAVTEAPVFQKRQRFTATTTLTTETHH